MSSESATYYVELNERLRVARLAAAQLAADDAEANLQSMIEQAIQAERKYNETVPSAHIAAPKRLSSRASADEIERYTAELITRANRIGVETARAAALAQLGAILATAQTVQQVTDWSEKLRAPERATIASSIPQTKADHLDRQNTISRILSRIDGPVTEDEQQSIKLLADEILSAMTALRAENLEVKLRAIVQRINDRARRIAEEKAAAAKMLAELHGFAGGDVEVLRQELEATIAGLSEAKADIAERVALVRKSAEKQANEIYVGEVLREELERLGYVVGDQFATLFVQGGHTFLYRPEQPSYGIQMQVDPVRGIMEVDVVRMNGADEISATEQRLRDLEAEERWCGDYERLRSVAHERGVAGRVIRRFPPGARKMPVIRSNQPVVSRRAEPMRQQRRN